MHSIMIIDDDATFRANVSGALKEKYAVREISSPADALAEIEKDPPEIILLDIRMPQMSGIELLQKIRATEKGKKITVIVSTNDSSLDTMSEGAELGIRGYVLKASESLKSIEQMIDRILSDPKSI